MTSTPLFRPGQSLAQALGARVGRLLVVDIGAAEYSGGALPPYASLMSCDRTEVLGFEPHSEARAATQSAARRIVMPHAIADGETHEFRSCAAPMTSSLLEPNMAWLERFENLADLCQVIDRETVATVRLDDVAEANQADFLKIDVQSATLMYYRAPCACCLVPSWCIPRLNSGPSTKMPPNSAILIAFCRSMASNFITSQILGAAE